MHYTKRVEAFPIGLVHIEKPGEQPATKMELAFTGCSPSDAEKLKSDIDAAIRESVKEINLGDDYVREETSNDATAVYRPL